MAERTHRRQRLRVTGQVQGVGFRPFVYRLATEFRLPGSVWNDPRGVTIEVQGARPDLEAFRSRIAADAPPLARVDDVVVQEDGPATETARTFVIEASDHAPDDRGRVTVDAATCEDCLREMRDAGDRRFGHALINCTNCGPRYTIIRDLPYDRPLTTMAPFAMCPTCRKEYEDPGDRRFHAQPTCCPVCGPRLRLRRADGRHEETAPIEAAARLLEQGGILAMKGLGGYHLVVDAGSTDAVLRLRTGKRRDDKPFALMVPDLAAARRLVRLSPDAEAALAAPDRPIVLAHKHGEDVPLAAGVAPRSHRLGLMLPYTPMQHLLLDRLPRPLVMTSANLSDDPLIAEDAEASDRLEGIADAFLFHDRAIERAVDDSIVIDGPRGILPVRRARGRVPTPLPLPVPADRPGLAVGGELKNTVAVVRGHEAVLSQHLGDLKYTLAHERFQRTIGDLERLFDVRPAWIACDAHPDYLSAVEARRRAAEAGLDLIEVQHHHAHMAAVLAEHGRTAPAIGITLDGVGWGEDGTSWGGEVLVGDLVSFRRAARLRPLPLPGGDAAARETGRPALAWIRDRMGPDYATHPVAAIALPDAARRRQVAQMLELDFHCPRSSGVGRLFDAAAALLGVCLENTHEAMSGMRLEALAATARRRPSGAGLLGLETQGVLLELDHRPLAQALLDMRTEPVEAAWQFHDAVADGFARAALAVRDASGIGTAALAGGVFLNTLLLDLVATRLEAAGMEVLLPRALPPNDGQIAFGQAAVAAARRGTRYGANHLHSRP